MKPSKSSGIFRPFEDLKTLIEKKSLPKAPSPADHRNVNVEAKVNVEDQPDPENEAKLFIEAMADVKPITRKKRIEKNAETRPKNFSEEHDPEADTLLRLKNLVEYGEGFIVADTPEYIEGAGYKVNPEVTRRLHRGDFSIQGHIDLHGLGVEAAREAFEMFLKDAIATGKRAVLIVHGRGLSSPEKPVLKTKVLEWVTSGPWRKWVIAFSSARLCDGGTGATYLLLRQRPFTKSQRKRKKPYLPATTDEGS